MAKQFIANTDPAPDHHNQEYPASENLEPRDSVDNWQGDWP